MSRLFLFGVLLGISLFEPTPGLSNEIRVLRIEGVINPLSSRYLERETERAAGENAHAVVLELNTPGGLESSMREMVQAMLGASIPVIVYVAPQGARAASAGMFLTIAGHVAAMAPGTNIGAAHPVGIGGAQEQKPDEVMKSKVVNDAAALARAVAKERGKNAIWAEEAVRKSVSITADEALAKQVIDIIAKDRNELLRKLHGRRVFLRSGEVVLKTAAARISEKPMQLPEKILHTITDPNIAYLLMSIGFIGIIAELYSPGLIFPGVIGVLSLLVGFTAIGSLPIGWAGLALLVLGILLLVFEAQAPGFGIFGIAGIVAFALGSLMLYTPVTTPSPALPQVKVSPWLIAAITAGFGAFVWVVFRAAVIPMRHPSPVGGAALIGSVGIALTELAPDGLVRIDSEEWSASLLPEGATDVIPAGAKVEVVAVDGVILKVRKAQKGS